MSQGLSNQLITNLLCIITLNNDWFDLLLEFYYEIYSLVSSILFVTQKKNKLDTPQFTTTTIFNTMSKFTPNTPTEGSVFSPLGIDKTFETLFDTNPSSFNVFSPEMDMNFSHLLPDEEPSEFQSLVTSDIGHLPSPTSLTNTTSNVIISRTKVPILKPPPKKIRKKEDNILPTCKQLALPTPTPPLIYQQVLNQQQQINLTLEGERCWKVICINQNLMQQFNIRIFTKTRCDTPCEHVTEKMYSSLKYEIRQHIFGPICSQQPFLLGRIQVVDSSTGQPIQKSDKKTVLKGIVECALTKPPGAKDQLEIQGVMKVQFTDVSYHHKKRDFCWELRYFVPNDLNNAILVMRSAPFKVFARKPNQNKKRKRTSTSYEDFCNRLEDLIKVSKKLKQDERKTALQLVSSKLLQSYPEYMKEIQLGGK